MVFYHLFEAGSRIGKRGGDKGFEFWGKEKTRRKRRVFSIHKVMLTDGT
jgi:hypothetical protein